MTEVIASPSDQEPPEVCLNLEHRFATNVAPDPVEAARLQGVICDRIEDGYVCGLQLGKDTPCLKMTGEFDRVGKFMTQAVFNSIIKSLED